MTLDARFSGEQFIKIDKSGIKLERVSHLLEKTWAFPWPASKKKLIAVGLPVTQQPPHRSRRAVFPHRALREYSLPQQD